MFCRFGEDGDDDDDEGGGMSRPFGVALLLGGWDEKGAVLFHADPSGTFVRYDAKAIGSGSEGAQTNLQESYRYVALVPIPSKSVTSHFCQKRLDTQGSGSHGAGYSQTGRVHWLRWSHV